MRFISLNWFKSKRAPPVLHPSSEQQNKGNQSNTLIRPELFSADQMERYGSKLALSHKLTRKKAPYYLLKRLDDNEKVLTRSCLILSGSDKSSITPAAEWLLDNFYLLEEQIRLVRQLLPRDFGQGLPLLAAASRSPRIYDIATEVVNHSDGHWDINGLTRFFVAYQTVSPLRLGELWAFPGMLRLALIENLRRVSIEVAEAQQERNLADYWVKTLQNCATHDPASLIIVIADMARSNPPRTSAFVAELVRRLQGHGTMLALPLTWVEQRLSEVGMTAGEVIDRFNHQLAVSQLSVSNSISGLRQLSEMDWSDFAENLSAVEAILRRDPPDIYAKMHFDTRDNYRHQIEVLSRHCQLDETAVARAAIELAHRVPAPERKRHVGYYLIGNGRRGLEKYLRAHFSLLTRMRRRFNQTPLLSWLGGLSLLTAACSGAALYFSHRAGMGAALWLLALPLLVVTSQFVMNLLSEITTRVRSPQPLPRLDFSTGFPDEYSTMVVIPCLFGSRANIDSLINSLEVCHLGNDMPHLYFALLSDFHDSSQPQQSEDQDLLSYAVQKIQAVNRRYPSDGGAIFSLLHRDRQWNGAQNVWMGYERKRGKLHALNRWLRGAEDNAFPTVEGGSYASLKQVKYVITLDSDTVLPRATAHQLIAAMAHPLNQPLYDERRRRVVAGYAILQPRLAEEIPRYGQARYAAMCGSVPGNDPYSALSSDLYQDLFGEGSYVGKGIYDVDMFTRATRNSCPENLVLSHDLLEGCYARSGMLSDVVFYEQYPASYLIDVARRVRWIRGDWQLLNWLRRRVRLADGARLPNPLSRLSRWKLLDNLRRSLVAPSLLSIIFCLFFALPNPFHWLCFLSMILLLPALSALLMDLVNKGRHRPVFLHVKSLTRAAFSRLARIALNLSTLPHESLFSLRAITVTLWRLLVSQRYLHQWDSVTADKKRFAPTAQNFYRRMWVNPLAAAVLLVLCLSFHSPLLIVALPLSLLWLSAPWLLCRMSQPAMAKQTIPDDKQRRLLRQTSRETWSFFETFVNQEANWLPPDNYQEIPRPVIAQRTSPTNIGLSLLSSLTAWDFGYTTQGEVLRRTSLTLDTLDKLEHYRGHLYNWYDTRTLSPLRPRYISSVDSGNLAGHLLTLSAGLADWRSQPIMNVSRVLAGLDDTLSIVEARWPSTAPLVLQRLRARWTMAEAATSYYRAFIDIHGMLSLMPALQQAADGLDAALIRWLRLLAVQLDSLCREWTLLLGWLEDAPVAQELPSLLWLAQREDGSPARRAAISEARQRLDIIAELEKRLTDHAHMDFKFLYHASTHLLSVGYSCEDNKLDSGKYDLLPSEVRLTNFVAIATNQLPQKSWFALGRLFTMIDKRPALMSWSGSMFEYLMPLLVMPLYPGTLLRQMCQSAVARQISWGKEHRIPWGISESAYSAFDNNQNYQYHAFGVPGLGLKRGLGDNMVVAPYATLLALMICPEKACDNLLALQKLGARGQYGFYEALDYTASRLSRGQDYVIVRSYMAHHQGMSLLALSHLLLDAPMVARFASYPSFQSARLLLQERVPDALELYSPRRHFESPDGALKNESGERREFHGVESPIPEIQLLSNTDYHLMLTQAGGGYSVWKTLALTRWREDATRDNHGIFCYLSDPSSGEVWSNTWQPVGKKAGQYHVVFNEAGVEFKRTEGALSMETHIVVSPEDDVELRRMTLIHRGRQSRTLDITTYAEVVLAPAAGDLTHPAFSNLFVQTELVSEPPGILCHRRPREPDEQCPWLFHTMAIHDRAGGAISFETDRAAFIGRSNTTSDPTALSPTGVLTNSAGAVLDPIMAIRQRVRLKPGVPVIIDMVYGITGERRLSLALLEKYRDRRIADRVFDIAFSHSQVLLRQLNVSEEDAGLFNRLAGAVLFPCQEIRGDTQFIMRNRRGQSGLWGHALSGDLPIVLLTLTSAEHIAMVTTMIRAHNYWRLKGLAVDLVLLCNDAGGYHQALQHQVMGLVAAGAGASQTDKPGGIFVRNGEHLTSEEHTLLMSVARIVLDDRLGELPDWLNQRMQITHVVPPRFLPSSTLRRNPSPPHLIAPPALRFFNGTGGFSADGREYQIILPEHHTTPAPWVNVLANADFGTVISESGQAYTWYENAHEYRLTPWENDPVSDRSGEAFYLRDEESGDVWSPSPLPVRGQGDYLTRHGFGYSVFEHQEQGIASELTVLVAEHDPVKLFILTLSNHCGRPRKLSVTGYVEWVLADMRAKSAMHIVTRAAQVTKGCGVLATNHYAGNGSERTAFFAVTGAHCSVSGDRREFLGRNGAPGAPQSMRLQRLSDRTGAALDPCGALQSAITLIDGDQHVFVFALGLGQNAADAERLIRYFFDDGVAQAELERIHHYWHRLLDKIQIATPDPALDLLTNGWLLYQTLSSRILARSGYYQSGGAFGFRDQLQDTLALSHALPERMREQIVLCAGRQFIEGDVQHWWHPPSGNGVRTRCSDDYLWLPLAICHYVAVTEDVAITEQSIAYLEGRPLAPGEESCYEQPRTSEMRETLWRHGVRAIRRSLNFGPHGLPLMGAGDWNDGMNLVGAGGQGESVWLGFFLYTVLRRYGDLARRLNDDEVATLCREQAALLQQNLHDHGWDGDWYLRGYFDNAAPLGSRHNSECQIDAIAQSWAVLSGAGAAPRCRQAMQALDSRLVDEELGLIKLLAPPFNGNGPNPGYIRGYLPGVRENGGQYTHAAIWAVMAFAEMGHTERAWRLMSMINPINHSLSAGAAARYKVEPYVMSADVYAVAPHGGRGGWSWYTGSAGWTYRLITESLLGITRAGDWLTFHPRLPAGWTQFTLTYQQGNSQYRVTIRRGDGAYQVRLDGRRLADDRIAMRDDGEAHQVEILLASVAVGGAIAPEE
ncbi:cyclic beta 1-2 glucan synthetase [Affinibrenneria salicis]|uniref:Cyclic beta 1-2 glucan synthetase n=1 Tax=Affinibrenneria salicis TaxID=2590031 RepID=A0A5J5FXZ0_9GAMM|nr:glucoamylase family protein [Affinibrenneria salicis]KAA8998984.1 cyclic beta 1-2 glucan synthetase [Affinibrenneria salicis]